MLYTIAHTCSYFKNTREINFTGDEITKKQKITYRKW